MLKNFINFITILIFAFYSNYSFAYTLNLEDKIIANKITYKLNKKLNNYNYKNRIKFLNKIKSLKNKYKNNKRIYSILNLITKNLEKRYNNKYQLNNLNIDINKIQQNWINRHNEKRIWIQKLSYSNSLNNTANAWSNEMAKKWIMTHKRNPNTKSYYDYNEIKNWLKERWVECIPIKWITFSESIWINYFKCKQNNCTNNLDKALKEIFNLYYQEKWLPYPQNAHYKAIIHPGLSLIWLWLNIENDKDWFYKVYITTHYCSKLKQ